jgi:hypothetical protein
MSDAGAGSGSRSGIDGGPVRAPVTDEEVAAVVVVLAAIAARAAAQEAAAAARVRPEGGSPEWASPARSTRSPRPRPSSWRSSALPR